MFSSIDVIELLIRRSILRRSIPYRPGLRIFWMTTPLHRFPSDLPRFKTHNRGRVDRYARFWCKMQDHPSLGKFPPISMAKRHIGLSLSCFSYKPLTIKAFGCYLYSWFYFDRGILLPCISLHWSELFSFADPRSLSPWLAMCILLVPMIHFSVMSHQDLGTLFYLSDFTDYGK